MYKLRLHLVVPKRVAKGRGHWEIRPQKCTCQIKGHKGPPVLTGAVLRERFENFFRTEHPLGWRDELVFPERCNEGQRPWEAQSRALLGRAEGVLFSLMMRRLMMRRLITIDLAMAGITEAQGC